MSDVPASDDPKAELELPAIVRDLSAGLGILALGAITGTTSFDGRADAIDYVFDGLGLCWIALAVVRFVRSRASGSPPSTPVPISAPPRAERRARKKPKARGRRRA